jgi:Putative transposase
MFRDKLLAFLKQSYRRNELCLPGAVAALSQARAFHSLLHTLRSKEWVVYSQLPFGGPEHVLKYLARYTHRVAISNGRLLSLASEQVRFRWRDSRHNNRSSVMTLDAVESIRRFLLHVLPSGFVKIRHFGLLAHDSTCGRFDSEYCSLLDCPGSCIGSDCGRFRLGGSRSDDS